MVWIEGRDLPPFPESIDDAVGDLGTEPALIVLDSYELISSLDSHLRDLVIPDLPDSTIVLIGAASETVAWMVRPRLGRNVRVFELDGLGRNQLADLARRHGVHDPALVADLVRTSHGSPLAVVLGASTGTTGSVAELAGRLMGSEADRDRYEVLTVAALARVTTAELLGAVLPAPRRIRRLQMARRPFVL